MTEDRPEPVRLFQPEDVISAYTRAQALADGVLVDVSVMAQEAGYKFPVALTRLAWDTCVKVPEGAEGQDEEGRLWDLLWMGRVAIGRSAGGRELTFGVHVRQNNRRGIPPLVPLRAICGPGDDGSPCLTIQLAGEID